ncbi:MAG: TIGR04282 family arsenosugar biosynthesis glycosyltransferase [Planctomycetota bacterium]
MNPSQGAIAVFVKTPGYSPLKTRLAASIGQTEAEQFHLLSAKAVEAVVQSAAKLKPVTPYWAVAEAAALSDPLWNQFSSIDQGTGDLGTRLSHVQRVLSETYDYVIFLGADAPQLPVASLAKAVELLSNFTARPQFVIGPASDGGFYLFGSQICLTREEWCQVPYSAANTTEMLLAQIQDRGDVHQLPVLTDVDTVDDLKSIGQEMSRVEAVLPAQRQVFEWIQQRHFQNRQ